ncbi:hypothetical protein CMU59_13725 [Elizabethkingia anophelis]|uniref:zinc ribbon domain-containing protein n=1 Tax=Elizabethkingia anophelis TaxID=1117645 RepID=UPI0020112398|nr:zinc ribbon domain-containing protein [Elizabethkingia anophelis]MCL1688584.1 zinc ribbon domain-containing protein [Elizabethkingia anophelis]MDV3575325.1 hypothetical protein [Elizabethkingia anophelis]MDV3599526.1 hypothetical protein [Elizabethkingia anophelis]MDV3606544.1 hypothetical protein [Elizabethkingia anophelis]MDV3639706.1 hypothetical protein [Elizabethkingia anophelis]
METNLPTLCYNCSKPLPSTGYFCGACLTQFKCKSCDTILEKDYAGCINCGTPKLNTEKKTTIQQNVNTFRLHETKDGRTIDASFSDDVAKDLAGILRDTASGNRIKTITSNIPSSDDANGKSEEIIDFAEAEVLNNVNAIPKAEAIPTPKSNTTTPDDYPSMKYIVMNNLPSSETEWIVVYAFYASDFGEKKFTRKDIIKKYEESSRKTDQRIKNLSGSITSVVKGKYLNPINDDDFSIMSQGIEKAKEIIARTSGSSPKSRSSSKIKKGNEDSYTEDKKAKSKRTSSALQSYKRLTDINFYPSGHKSLIDFIKDYEIKNDNERNLLFTHYLSEILKINPITLNHLYTSYDEVNHKIPENLTQSLNNTKYRTGWLKTNNSNIEITIKGVNKLKIWDKKD